MSSSSTAQLKLTAAESLLWAIDCLRSDVHTVVESVLEVDKETNLAALKMNTEKQMQHAKTLLRNINQKYAQVIQQLSITPASTTKSEASTTSKKRDFVKSCLERQVSTQAHKRPRLINPASTGTKLTKNDLETLKAKLKSEYPSILSLTLTGSEALTNGIQVTTKLWKASILFKTPIHSTPTPLVLSRINIVGTEESASLWVPSQLLVFKRFTNSMAPILVDMRIKYPETQLEHFVVSCSRNELLRVNLNTLLDSE